MADPKFENKFSSNMLLSIIMSEDFYTNIPPPFSLAIFYFIFKLHSFI